MFHEGGPIAVLRFLCENCWKGVAAAAAAAAGHFVGVAAAAAVRVRVAVVAAAHAAAASFDAAAPLEASNASDPA